MKMSVGKRLLMLAHWLFSLLICAALAIYLIAPALFTDCLEKLRGSFGDLGVKLIGIAVLLIYVALAIVQLLLIVKGKRRSERGFITVESGDNGRVRISIMAIEQMVRRSVHTIDGISEMKIDIENLGDAIAIGVNAVIINGSHVPTITMNMQRSIRQFVEMNCGVAVRTVSISINDVANPAEGGRRLFGRAKIEQSKRAVPGNPLTPGNGRDAIASEASTVGAPAVAAAETPESAETTCSEGIQAENRPEATEVYDIDKPFESQFERDLEAMRSEEGADMGAEGTSMEVGDDGAEPDEA